MANRGTEAVAVRKQPATDTAQRAVNNNGEAVGCHYGDKYDIGFENNSITSQQVGSFTGGVQRRAH